MNSYHKVLVIRSFSVFSAVEQTVELLVIWYASEIMPKYKDDFIQEDNLELIVA